MQRNLIIGLFFALLIAVFSIQNSGPVSLVLFKWYFETYLVVVVLGGVVIGALLMGMFSSLKQFSLSRRIKGLKNENEGLLKKNKELEKRIISLDELLNDDNDTENEEGIEDDIKK